MPQYYRQIGDAVGYAMAHNARMAADIAVARAAEDAARGERPACACRAPGQDGDGWVRYQARDREFVTLRCRNHTTQEGWPVDLTATQFNERYPVGTAVIAYPGVRPEHAATVGMTDYPRLATRTRSSAWNLGHGEPVVLVEGYAGGISLEHIDLDQEQVTTAHVEYAFSRREGANSLGNYHLVLDQPLHSGRLHRDTHDALCKPRRRFWGLEPRPKAQADCPRCLLAAARHGVTVAGGAR
jgi:hypothetical protein